MKLPQHPSPPAGARSILRRHHGHRPLHISRDQEGVHHRRRGRGGRTQKRQEPQATLDVRVSVLEEAGGQFGEEEREKSDPEPAARARAPVQPGSGAAQQRKQPQDAPNRGEETEGPHPRPGAHGAHAER